MDRDRQDALYVEASGANAAAMRRVARGYEANADRQRDLLQEMHLELWLSFRSFDGRCSLRTWVYRIAHNVGASHIVRARRMSSRLVDLETLDAGLPAVDGATQVEQRVSAAMVLELIHRLKPLDRQVILLYMEGESAGAIAEVTGVSPVNVATKIHRIKRMLREKYQEGGENA